MVDSLSASDASHRARSERVEDEVHVDFEAERRETVLRQAPIAILTLLTFAFVYAAIEWNHRPDYRSSIVFVDALFLLVSLGGWVAARIRPRGTVLIAVLCVNACVACLQLYSVLVRGSGELNVLATTLILGGVVALLPLGARNQLLSSTTAVVGYPLILTLGVRAHLDAVYSVGGLFSAVATLAMGAHTVDRYRLRILHQSAEQARLAAANASLAAQAHAAHVAKSEFLATVAHELRNPLSAIMGYSDLLREGAFPEPQAADDTLRRIHGQAVGMLDTLQNLLDIDKADAGQLRLELVQVEMRQFLAEVRAEVPLSWDKPEVVIDWHLPDVPVTVETDVRKLKAIVRNLLHNAIKYTQRGRVTVAVTQANVGVVLSVTDTGEGIPHADLPHVFDRFRQAQNPTRSGGVGLGLHIVKRFSEALGADIEAQSTLGQGSRFVLTLPDRSR